MPLRSSEGVFSCARNIKCVPFLTFCTLNSIKSNVMLFVVMKKRIYLYHENRAYLERAAQRLSLKLRGAELHIAERPGAEGSKEDIYIMNGYGSMAAAAADISERFALDPLPSKGGCSVIMFTSGVGGAGTTTAAKAYGRILSRLSGFKTLYLSFDYLSCKGGPLRAGGSKALYEIIEDDAPLDAERQFARDGYGLYYMLSDSFSNPCSRLSQAQLTRLINRLCGSFERIVADVPQACRRFIDLTECCDLAVVCTGWQEERFGPSMEIADFLHKFTGPVIVFSASFDEGSLDDIYGQFGAEVRGLVQKYEGAAFGPEDI